MLIDLSNPTPGMTKNFLNPRQTGFIYANMRVLWHQLFDLTPRLSERLGTTLNSTFDNFLASANQLKQPLDWRISIHFLEFLFEKKILTSQDRTLIVELIVAAVARWIGTSIGPEVAIKITSSFLKGEAIVGIKERGSQYPRKVLIVPEEKMEDNIVSFQFFEHLKLENA